MVILELENIKILEEIKDKISLSPLFLNHGQFIT